ncbi:Satratoxin biosynthesis SC1 cluster protein 4 [Colletotrichum siamense]|uniref:Satratoxin biosynthesis SC1 cluster protein 4 n=1 Tax=Colletotrichum siamense TaxID=690259 RepID=A0A9P5BPQ4_COLSI|nr:Satratoxin biosynthesis SC1 cluster protein 4 [Colletotrichum siamense]KAF4844705.1 Satratoxin biosynthesis SC1 cluster protein 4 [Colletotrichum siamense]
MEAPPGINPNDSRQTLIIGVTSFVLSVAFLAVTIRTYTRVFLLRQFGIDDGAAIFTFFLIFACGFSVAIKDTRNGFGTHVYFLNEDQIKSYLRTFYITIVFYNASLAGIKMTFLFQYWRVLAIQKMKKIFIAAMILVGGWSISQILVEIFICTPIPTFWDKDVKGTCIPNYPQWYINAAGNIITDLLVFVLPLPVIGNLKLAPGQKYVLVGIFCLGFFTCAISFVRIRFLHQAEDFTWENVETAGWSVGELCCGLTCACLPTFRPLVSKFIPALSSRITKSSKYQGQYAYGSSRTAGTSKHRDVELAITPPQGSTGGSPNRYSKRRPDSSDSKADLYGAASYDLSHTDSSRDTPLPIQGTNQTDSESVPSPMMFRQQQHDTIDVGGYGADQTPMVETHIEAGRRYSGPVRKPSGPIEVQHDIVQISSPKVVEPKGFS